MRSPRRDLRRSRAENLELEALAGYSCTETVFAVLKNLHELFIG